MPGVGNITIVSDTTVSKRDLGRNFFVDVDSMGKSLSEVCLNNLLEMNPDVSGTSIVEDPVQYFNKISDQSNQNETNYTLIIIDDQTFVRIITH